MATRQGESSNPYDICTWRPASECADCPIVGQLKCRFDWGDLLHFIGLFIGFALPSIIGMMRGSYSWYLLGWAATHSCS